MTAFQHGIHVALDLDLLKAELGYDLVGEVALPFNARKDCVLGTCPLCVDFLENDLPGLGSHLRLCGGNIGCRPYH
jgi:hypothetical protein